jgi:hypothetical protein
MIHLVILAPYSDPLPLFADLVLPASPERLKSVAWLPELAIS